MIAPYFRYRPSEGFDAGRETLPHMSPYDLGNAPLPSGAIKKGPVAANTRARAGAFLPLAHLTGIQIRKATGRKRFVDNRRSHGALDLGKKNAHELERDLNADAGYGGERGRRTGSQSTPRAGKPSGAILTLEDVAQTKRAKKKGGGGCPE